MSGPGEFDSQVLEQRFPDKIAPLHRVFSHIRRGDQIFVHTGCAEPQFLVHSLAEYAENNPKAFFDTEVYHVWSLGVAPYADAKLQRNFRHNSFFVGEPTRGAVNSGLADYTPVFLSQVPGLFRKRLVDVDVALIQVSTPDRAGFFSLGVSVDITLAAVRNAKRVIAQVNPRMPRVHGDAFVHADDIDFLVWHDEPLLEYAPRVSDEIAREIGRYTARLVRDGDTLQVGYGSVPNAILANLQDHRHLGIHTELLTQGIVDLMEQGVVDNSQKSVNPGKTVASFCMGTEQTYRWIHDNPAVEFRDIEYTNAPLIIARQENMVAINSALEIDLTGQATAESIGAKFYSGIGGQADFMRGAVLAPGGKTILTLQSTAENGEVSRVVPALREGAGVTLGRGDVHYVVTEHGIAYLHGKNVRERALALISVAHPAHRQWLIDEAKKRHLIYADQAFVPGEPGEYPEEIETFRTTKAGLGILLRPVRFTDESLLKDFFYSLSDKSLYTRFISQRKDMPHERLQSFTVIDYTKEMVVLAVVTEGERDLVVGLGQFGIHEKSHTAEVAFVTRDDYQGKGIGRELLNYLTYLAKRMGLQGFTAEVLLGNKPMMHLFETAGFEMNRIMEDGVYELSMGF